MSTTPITGGTTARAGTEARRRPNPVAGGRWKWVVLDSLALTRRNLLHYVRVPQLLVFTFVQPIMFVLLFRYVFGGTINVPGLDYVDYLMPGIFGQVVVFGSTNTALGLAEDLQSGIIERFRSLPMVRSSVLLGRTAADLVRNTGVVIVMFVVGVLVGFRPQGSLPAMALALALVLGFAYSLSWVMAVIGLRAPTAESAQAAAFPLLFPLTFASAAFVPVNTMPGWLQVFAAHQPVTVVVNAARGLLLGPGAATELREFGAFTTSTASYVLQTIGWIVLILALAVPSAVRLYNRL
jgi:ABC-2 type transport system permease protein/oleandomycin transport system permease protein